MKFISLSPFVPSGPDFESAKQLFLELGFSIRWDAGDYTSFQSGECKFILQKFDDRKFAENFMISVGISNADEFWNDVNEKQLVQRYGIRLSKPQDQPYGREVNIIDIAGVCWHFVQA